MTAARPEHFDPHLLQRWAAVLAAQSSEITRTERTLLAAALRDAARGHGPAGIGDAVALLMASSLAPDSASKVPIAETAAVLDALDDGPPESPNPAPPSVAEPVLAGPVEVWSAEVRRLLRNAGIPNDTVGGAVARQGLPPAPGWTTQADPLLTDPLLAESTVGALGGEWIEGRYHSLYRSARRALARHDAVDAVSREVSGLASVNELTATVAEQQLAVPDDELPVLRGREAAIAELVAALGIPDRPVQVLVGRGGYGKSSVAMALAQEAAKRHVLVMWVPAPDHRALIEGLHLAALGTGATARQLEDVLAAPPERRATRLWALLDESPRRWLLVLDDAGGEAVGSPDWVHRSGVGTVVITSRHDVPGWGADAQITRIGELDPADGGRVVLDRLGMAAPRVYAAQASELSRHLAGMPLALTSAGRLAAAAGGGPELTALVDRLRDAADRGPLPAVYEIGLESFPVPEQDAARELLRLLACFAPNEPLPYRVLGSRPGMDGLVDVGLVERMRDAFLRIHPAVAEHARREWAAQHGDDASLDLEALALLTAEIDRLDGGLASDWPAICLLEPHVAELVGSPLVNTDHDLQVAVLVLADRTAESLMRAGLHTAATSLLAAARGATKALGEEHPARLAARRTTAWMTAFDGGGDLRAAEEQLLSLVEEERRLLGPDAPQTLAAEEGLAWLRTERGAVEEGHAAFERILRARRRTLGDRHPDTLATWHRLAWSAVLLRREQWGTEELRAVLDARIAVHGPRHLDVFSTRYRLAWAQCRSGDLAGAESGFRSLFDDIRDVLGPRHPLTLLVRVRVGWVLERSYRFAAAQRTYTEVLADQLEIFGEGHPRVLRTQQLIAYLTLQLGRAARAVREFRVVVEGQEKVLGIDHHNTLISRSCLAWALMRSGQAEAAEREFAAVLADRGRAHGDDHPLTLMARNLQARTLLRRGRLIEAERQLRELVRAETSILGAADLLVFETRHALARVAALRGRLVESEARFDTLLVDRDGVLGSRHPDTLATRDHRAWVLGLQGRVDEALAECQEVLRLRGKVLGPSHPHTLTSRYRTVWLTGIAGNWPAAFEMAEALLGSSTDALGHRHPDTLRCRMSMIRALRQLARLDEAEGLARQVVVAQTEVQGSRAVDTLRAREELALIILSRGDRTRAAELLDTLDRDRREALGDDHPDVRRGAMLHALVLGDR